MSWGEALRLIRLLQGDTTSQTAAACEGWKFPVSRDALAIYDLFDVTVLANTDGKRGTPKPHSGRPFEINDRKQQKLGNAGGRSREEVLRILRDLGHNVPAA